MRRFALLLTLVAVATGCGSDDDVAATPEATTTAAGSDFPDELTGEYEREVTQADIDRTADKRVEGPGQEPPAPGLYRLVVNEGVIQVFLPDDFEISQQMTVDGDTWEIGPYTGGEGVFCADDGPSTYRWELNGSELTLTPESDPCADRDSTLTGTWKKSG